MEDLKSMLLLMLYNGYYYYFFLSFFAYPFEESIGISNEDDIQKKNASESNARKEKHVFWTRCYWVLLFFFLFVTKKIGHWTFYSLKIKR